MSDNIDKLRAESEKAEAEAQRLMREKDKLRDRLRKATDEAAAAQKRLNDAEAVEALAARDDLDDRGKRDLADRLGLELPT